MTRPPCSRGDMAITMFAWKRCREFGRRMKCFRGEYPSAMPQFPEGSEAFEAVKITTPVPYDAPDIKYTPEDDAAIEKLIRDTGESHTLACWAINSQGWRSFFYMASRMCRLHLLQAIDLPGGHRY